MLFARCFARPAQRLDRKSTRLNSSHSQISYAVFCLKKKSEQRTDPLCLEVDRRFQRGLKTLARQEPPHRSPGEAPAGHVRREPPILRAPRKKPSQQAHTR